MLKLKERASSIISNIRSCTVHCLTVLLLLLRNVFTLPVMYLLDRVLYPITEQASYCALMKVGGCSSKCECMVDPRQKKTKHRND